MWVQLRSNRLTADREQVKEHLLHMQRLRNIKPSIDMKKPPKPTHITNNYKKELQKQERLSEIQYQNRVLLRKMLQIDLKPSINVGAYENNYLQRNSSQAQSVVFRPQSAKTNNSKKPVQQSAQSCLNSYTSLNRANRIRSLAKIIDQNKVLLDKLQNTKSCYNCIQWKQDYSKKAQLQKMIRENGDRYCRNPYFLNSVCTINAGLPTQAYTEAGSLHGGKGGASQQALSAYYQVGDRTTSDFGSKKIRGRRAMNGKASESNFAAGDGGQETLAPPKLKKKVRPYSAPRHQGYRSNNIKNKIGNMQYKQQQQILNSQDSLNQAEQIINNGNNMGMMQYQNNQQYMDVVNEQNNNNQFAENDEDDEQQNLMEQEEMDDEDNQQVDYHQQ